jgi:hypothetical protein
MIELSKPVLAGFILLLLLALWTLYGVFISASVPEAQYEVLETLDNKVEIRSYPVEIWATTVAGDQNQAFSSLFNYISGNNDRGEKIEMTVPVVTRKTEEGHFMAFVMPERFDYKSVLKPSSDRVKIESIAARKLATIKFSGHVTQGNFEKNRDLLTDILKVQGISTKGEPFLMQYNDPWTPPFLRRNEIALEVDI